MQRRVDGERDTKQRQSDSDDKAGGPKPELCSNSASAIGTATSVPAHSRDAGTSRLSPSVLRDTSDGAMACTPP